jgi:hypothetical protein
LGGVLMMMSPGRKRNPSHRALSVRKLWYRTAVTVPGRGLAHSLA